ncbi:hypothetical protein [Neptuniibacter pectenicola]|uniref:hypothetical protein n=1 Tax=Neptuniibacter pectenicola TaxID=1806669 RepID=UPI0030EC4512|tara:strand:+ start:2813 stop:3274 length:462 start_codon:yes stop_codon:yes gene_type:complete
MLRNPLIIVDGDLCRFKYDFIADYFKSLYIINALNSKSCNSEFIKLIAKNAYGENEVMASVSKYYSNKNVILIENCKFIINSIKENISPLDVMSKNDVNFRAIAFLVKLNTESNNCGNSKEQFKILLTKLFDNDGVFKNLAIYGDQMALRGFI